MENELNKKLDEIFEHDRLVRFKLINFINEILWVCAGVNRKVLRQCPTEHAKYAGIGGTIFFTAVLASISGGYAIYKVFADEVYNESLKMYDTDINAMYIAVVFGLIWGLIIFNLDRFMVNTMYSDGTQKITPEEWRGGAPRLILAFFIGIVISTPLELRIFKDKIQAQIVIEQGEVLSKMDEKQQSIRDEIKKLQEDKEKNQARVDKITAERDSINEKAYKEATGTGGSGIAGRGIYTKQLEEQAKKKDYEIEETKKNVNKDNSYINKQLQEKYNLLNDYSQNNKLAAKSMKGFAAELHALNTITSPFEDFSLFAARLLIMLLFVAVEIIPTLFKLMMIDGTYDAIIKAEKHKIRVLTDKSISDLNDNVNTDVKISTEKNRERLEAELLANKEFMEKLARTQAEILQTAIDKWREEELAKINENPSAYIKTNNQS